jgi:hypothetical protein
MATRRLEWEDLEVHGQVSTDTITTGIRRSARKDEEGSLNQ